MTNVYGVESLNNLRNELGGKEISFFELDSKMEENGFYTVLNDGVTSNIKENENVCYLLKEDNETQVIINFITTENNGVDEVEESFILKVIEIDFI